MMLRVVRWCCVTGNCERCAPHGRRVRIVEADRLTREQAAILRDFYAVWEAVIEDVPDPGGPESAKTARLRDESLKQAYRGRHGGS